MSRTFLRADGSSYIVGYDEGEVILQAGGYSGEVTASKRMNSHLAQKLRKLFYLQEP